MPDDRRPSSVRPSPRSVLFVALVLATPLMVAGHVGKTTPCRHAGRFTCYPETGTVGLAGSILAVLALSVAGAAVVVSLAGWLDRRYLGGRLAVAGERPSVRFFLAPGRRALVGLGGVLALSVATAASGPVVHPPAVPGLRPARRILLFALFFPEVLAVAAVDALGRHYGYHGSAIEARPLLVGSALGALPQVAWWYGLAHLVSRDRSFLHDAGRPGVLSTPGRRRVAAVAVLAVVVLAAGVGAVRTVDPGPPDYATHEVDPSEPPPEVVHDALRRVEQGRYTVEVVVYTRDLQGRLAPVESPPDFEGRPILGPVREPAPPARRLHVDVPDRQVRIERLYDGDAEPTWFGNARLGWRHEDGRLRVHPADYGGAWTYTLALLLNEDSVAEDHAEFAVVSANATTLVARVDGEAAASNLVAGNVGGDFSRCRFVVDRTVRRLRRVTCESAGRRPARVLDLRFSDWGRDLPRPDGARYTLHEVVLDVLDVGEGRDTAPPRNTPARAEASDDPWDREDD